MLWNGKGRRMKGGFSMFEIRTDLAEELRSHAMAADAKSSAGEIDGVLYQETEKDGVRISTIDKVLIQFSNSFHTPFQSRPL